MATLWASGTQGMVGAILLSGNNLKLTGLKIMGFGTKALRECFPVGIVSGPNHGYSQMGNVLVEDCLFTEPAPIIPEGLSALVVAGTTNVSLTIAVVRGCRFTGLRPHFVTAQAATAIHVENWIIQDCVIGVYFEPEKGITEGVGPVMIRSNAFINVDSAVYLAMHTGTTFESITMMNNEVVLNTRSGYALSICDSCYVGENGTVTNVTILNNLVRHADWAPRTSSLVGGFAYSDIQHAVIGNNILALGSPSDLRIRPCPTGNIRTPGIPEDCDNLVSVPPGPVRPLPCLEELQPGYRRAWFNNRKFSGTLSEIRVNKNGVDLPALPQQWNE